MKNSNYMHTYTYTQIHTCVYIYTLTKNSKLAQPISESLRALNECTGETESKRFQPSEQFSGSKRWSIH